MMAYPRAWPRRLLWLAALLTMAMSLVLLAPRVLGQSEAGAGPSGPGPASGSGAAAGSGAEAPPPAAQGGGAAGASGGSGEEAAPGSSATGGNGAGEAGPGAEGGGDAAGDAAAAEGSEDGGEPLAEEEAVPTEEATEALEDITDTRETEAEEPSTDGEEQPTEDGEPEEAPAEGETDPAADGADGAAEPAADPTPTAEEQQDQAAAPARQMTSEEEEAARRAEAQRRARQLGRQRRDTLQSTLSELSTTPPEDEADERSPEEIREIQERTLIRLAQIARVELASCRRELAERRAALTEARDVQSHLERRMEWEPAAVRSGRKLVTEARLEVEALSEACLEYEQQFNALLAEYADEEDRVGNYEALLEQATTYRDSLERQAVEGASVETRLELAEETVEDLEGCVSVSRDTVSIITDTLSRLSMNVDLASELAIALERAATIAARRSVLQRGTSPLSGVALKGALEDVKQAPSAARDAITDLPGRLAAGWEEMSERDDGLSPPARIVLAAVMVIAAIMLLRWLWASLPRWYGYIEEEMEEVAADLDADTDPLEDDVDTDPETTATEIVTATDRERWRWRSRTTYAVLADALTTLVLFLIARLFWDLQDVRHGLILVCIVFGFLAYYRLLHLAISPRNEHRLLLTSAEEEIALPYRFGLAVGIAALVFVPLEASLVIIGYERFEVLSLAYLLHALAFLLIAAVYVPRVRSIVHPRFTDRIPAVRLLGEADLFLVGTMVLYVALSALGYTRLAILIFKGVLLTGLSFYGVYILGRRTAMWLIRRHPAPGRDASESVESSDDVNALRSVGWDLILTAHRLAIAAIGVLLIAWAWGLKAPHLEFVHTFLSRSIMEVQGTEVSLWGVLRALFLGYLIFFFAKITRRLIAGSGRLEQRFGAGARYAAAHLWFYIVVTIGFLWALLAAGFQWSILTVFAGMAGIGLGFGLQDVVKNFISGLIILVERPMRVGDLVDVAGETGYVTDISLRSTTIRTPDNIHMIIPNSSFVDQNITNFSIRDRRIRLRVEVGVHYGSDLDDVRDALLKVASGDRDVLDHPEARVFLTGFGDSSIDFMLMVWISRPHPLVQLQVKTRLIREIAAEFRRRDIEIPFPQRDLYIRSAVPMPISKHEGDYGLG
ncbi:MAG: mechanosensitive ion channel, partial [Armatimonadia bacterium]|nr:mechanosensitive ion channel [Armatimonadia bacterium]